MSTSIRLIRRYVWFIETLRRGEKMTMEEINSKWRDERSLRLEGDLGIAKRTFHRHRNAIADLFGIDIECDRSDGNTYYIANEEELDRPGFSSWLFNGLAIYNQIVTDRNVTDRIMFEACPGGSEYLPVLVESIVRKQPVRISYRSYNRVDLREHEVEPYGLKQSAKRWYLVGHIVGFEGLTVFALDRMGNVEPLDGTFQYDKNLDLKTYFDEVIGVNLEEEYDCEEVRLRVYGRQRDYIDSLPLHRSQKLIARTDSYSDYSFTLRAEYEFQHEVLKMGYNAEVLSPQWLRDEIRWRAQEILKLYSRET